MARPAHQPLRLVLDTNIVVAGLLWGGPPRQLLEAAIAGEVELCSSAVLLDELGHTLGYSKFAARIASFGTSTRRAGRHRRPQASAANRLPSGHRHRHGA